MKLIIVFMLIIIFVLVIAILSILFIVRNYGEKYIIELDELPKDNDAIIVLGAGVRADGKPSDILADRLETALKVYKNKCSEKLLLSGDHGRVEYNEVKAMKNYMVKANVDETYIFLDHAGFCTYDTMYRAKEIFKVSKAIIVTNRYHLPRALYIAKRLGIDVYGVASDIRNYDLMKVYKRRELLAQLKDFILVNILKPKSKLLGHVIDINKNNGKITDDYK